MNWKGWPGKSTARRRWLDDLYWGDDPRKVEEGHYHTPFVHTEVVTVPLATFRDAHTGDGRADEHMREFVSGWKEWRAHGGSAEARRTNAFRVRDHTEFIPRRIAFWERPP